MKQNILNYGLKNITTLKQLLNQLKKQSEK
jgi:hypothetical protein